MCSKLALLTNLFVSATVYCLLLLDLCSMAVRFVLVHHGYILLFSPHHPTSPYTLPHFIPKALGPTQPGISPKTRVPPILPRRPGKVCGMDMTRHILKQSGFWAARINPRAPQAFSPGTARQGSTHKSKGQFRAHTTHYFRFLLHLDPICEPPSDIPPCFCTPRVTNI